MKIIPRPGLDRWKEEKLVEATLTVLREQLKTPLVYGEELTDGPHATWQDMLPKIRRIAASEGMKAADIGSAIHRALEARVLAPAAPCGPWKLHAERAYRYLVNLTGVKEWEAERSFATADYGGKVDLLNREAKIIVDLKTTETHFDKDGKQKRLHWPEHLMQLVAYALGVFKAFIPVRLINLYVDYDANVTHHEWGLSPEEMQKEWLRFMAIVDAYKAIHRL